MRRRGIDLPVGEIAEQYLAGASSAELGRMYHVDAQTILNRLRERQVPIRRGTGVPRARPEGGIEAVVRTYRGGASVPVIAGLYGVCSGTVYRWLADAGVTTRGRSGQGSRRRAVKMDTGVCGTDAGYARHWRRRPRELPCGPCVAAHRARAADVSYALRHLGTGEPQRIDEITGELAAAGMPSRARWMTARRVLAREQPGRYEELLGRYRAARAAGRPGEVT